MSVIKVSGNTGGTGIFHLRAPNSSTDRFLDLPDNTGTIITTESTQSKFPIFRVNGIDNYGSQASSTSAFNAKTVDFDTTNSNFIDTHSFFNPSTNVYTPTIAGYYHVNFALGMGVGNNTTDRVLATVSLNDDFGVGAQLWDSGNNFTIITSHSNYILYLNGSTDNLRFKFYCNGTSRLLGYAFATIHYLRS